MSAIRHFSAQAGRSTAHAARLRVRPSSYVLVYAVIAAFIVLAHGPLLWTPFYWDEIGQFVPASLDLYHSGALIPHSTLPNVHPPGVMVYLAAFWHVTGYSIAGTRVAMLLVAALGVLFSFLLAIELSRGSPGAPALAAAAFLCLSPLFFAQAMLAELDMPAMCCTALALVLFLQNRFRASAIACVALVLVKETGIVAPALFGVWLVAERRIRQAAWFMVPATALAAWLIFLKYSTGHWLGNAQFTQYNVFYPLNPVRLFFALLRRLYYIFVGTGHIVGTVAVWWAWKRMPLLHSRAWRVCAAFTAAHIVTVSMLGGAVLERYLLPVLPILYAGFSLAFRALPPRARTQAAAALLTCLIAANFIYPPYPFPFENNLAFVSFADLGTETAAAVELRPGVIATTFPMSDALRRPECGYISRRRQVIELKGFRVSDIQPLQNRRPDMMIVYDTAWDPLHILDSRLSRWLMGGYYGFARSLTPEEIAEMLSFRVAGRWRHRGLSMALLVRSAQSGAQLSRGGRRGGELRSRAADEDRFGDHAMDALPAVD